MINHPHRYGLVQQALVLTTAVRSDYELFTNCKAEFMSDLALVKDLLTRVANNDPLAEQTLNIIDGILAGTEQIASVDGLAQADPGLFGLHSFYFEQQFNSQDCTSWRWPS